MIDCSGSVGRVVEHYGLSVARLLTRSGIFSLAEARDRLVFGDADGSVHFVQVCGAEFETTLS